MKKFRLQLSELRVESFPVSSAPTRSRGTVHAYDDSVDCMSDPLRTCDETAYGMRTCEGYGSCDPAMICQDTSPYLCV